MLTKDLGFSSAILAFVEASRIFSYCPILDINKRLYWVPLAICFEKISLLFMLSFIAHLNFNPEWVVRAYSISVIFSNVLIACVSFRYVVFSMPTLPYLKCNYPTYLRESLLLSVNPLLQVISGNIINLVSGYFGSFEIAGSYTVLKQIGSASTRPMLFLKELQSLA